MPTKVWRDYPDASTPINAASLIDLETRAGAYADAAAGYNEGWNSGTINPTFNRFTAQTSGNGTALALYNCLAVVPPGYAGAYTKMRCFFVAAGTGVTFRLGVWDWVSGTVIAQTADLTTANIVANGSLAQQTFSLSSNAGVTDGQILTFGVVQTWTTTAAQYRLVSVGNGAWAPFYNIGAETGIPANPQSMSASWAGPGNALTAAAARQKNVTSASIPYLELAP